MSRKQIFGAQIENNTLDNWRRSKTNGYPLFITFFSVLQRARPSGVIFLQRLIARRVQRRRQAALLRVFTAFVCRNVGLGVSCGFFQDLSTGLKTLLNSNALNMWWKENFRVTRETFHFICTTVAPVIQRQDTILRAAKWNVYWLQVIYTYTYAIFFFRHTPTRTRQRPQKTCTLLFFK